VFKQEKCRCGCDCGYGEGCGGGSLLWLLWSLWSLWLWWWWWLWLLLLILSLLLLLLLCGRSKLLFPGALPLAHAGVGGSVFGRFEVQAKQQISSPAALPRSLQQKERSWVSPVTGGIEVLQRQKAEGESRTNQPKVMIL
jgi:hypothetical protein